MGPSAVVLLVSGHPEGAMTHAEQRARPQRQQTACGSHSRMAVDTLLGCVTWTMAHSLA